MDESERASRSVACCVALGWDGIGTTRYEAERDETRRNGTKRDDGYDYIQLRERDGMDAAGPCE